MTEPCLTHLPLPSSLTKDPPKREKSNIKNQAMGPRKNARHNSGSNSSNWRRPLPIHNNIDPYSGLNHLNPEHERFLSSSNHVLTKISTASRSSAGSVSNGRSPGRLGSPYPKKEKILPKAIHNRKSEILYEDDLVVVLESDSNDSIKKKKKKQAKAEKKALKKRCENLDQDLEHDQDREDLDHSSGKIRDPKGPPSHSSNDASYGPHGQSNLVISNLNKSAEPFKPHPERCAKLNSSGNSIGSDEKENIKPPKRRINDHINLVNVTTCSDRSEIEHEAYNSFLESGVYCMHSPLKEERIIRTPVQGVCRQSLTPGRPPSRGGFGVENIEKKIFEYFSKKNFFQNFF